MMTVPYGAIGRRQRRRLLLRVVLRSLATVSLVVVLYYLAPLERALSAATALSLALALLLFLGVVSWQVRAVLRAPYPRLRALEALATVVPMLLVLFSVAYLLIDRGRVGSFSEPLTRTDALYFTVTVFSTVGFGDIVPATAVARIVTMGQMLFDVLALGVIAKTILGAVEIGLRRRPGPADSPQEEELP
jgi:voltage-gated potassium channel